MLCGWYLCRYAAGGCESSGGVDVGSCDDPSPECVAPTGACCTATGCNENVLEAVCIRASNNTWGGVGSTCDDVGFCEENELGACCHSDGCIEQSKHSAVARGRERVPLVQTSVFAMKWALLFG